MTYAQSLSLRVAALAALSLTATPKFAPANDLAKLAELLRKTSPTVLKGEEATAGRRLVRDQLREQLQAANDQSRTEYNAIKSHDDWQKFRKLRIDALKASLGNWPKADGDIRVVTARQTQGDGFIVENIVYQSRPNWWVTANLYRPDKPTKNMPGIIISHSHHRPKEHGELQAMGMTWARAGCVVLVPDHLGHGERAQHGLKSADDFPRDFQVSRQDYYFRYDNSIQLYLTGESLMGWMAWDLMRGVDVLLQLAPPLAKGGPGGVDPEKIILMGAVAGGGDPCAVTAAIDDRIACAVPFNFGGPQPETRYPLPEDAETSFNYAGSGSWESTRNLAFSATTDSRFLPWEIVAGIAPRRLIFAHEFSWHRERDPVWKRLEHVYTLHDARDHLAFAHGKGELRGKASEASHCTHIGKFHRVKIHEALEKWFDIHAEEYSNPIDSSKLRAGAAVQRNDVTSSLLCELLSADTKTTLQSLRTSHSELKPRERRDQMRKRLANLLCDVEFPRILSSRADGKATENFTTGEFTYGIQRPVLNRVPLLLLVPDQDTQKRRPIVIGLSQGGKAAFLEHRADEIARLLKAGIAVCLPDVRNTSALAGDDSRGRYSAATSRAATALMVGDPILAQQLRDVRTIIAHLRHGDWGKVDRIALWGDSFAELNKPDANFRVPRRIDGRPHQVEPLGGTLAMLAALFEDHIHAVCIHRGLAEFQGTLDSPFVYIPLDSVIPGLLTAGDLPDIAASLAPTRMQLAGMVDAYNRSLTIEQTEATYGVTHDAYRQADAAANLHFTDAESSPAKWLIEQLRQ